MATPLTPRPQPAGEPPDRNGSAAARSATPPATPAVPAQPATPGTPAAQAATPPTTATAPAKPATRGTPTKPAKPAKPARAPGALERSAPIDVHVPPPPAPEDAVRRPPAPLRGGPLELARFMRRHRMLSPNYALLLARWAWLKLRWGARLETDGICFVAPTVKLEIKRGATLRLGRWSWIGHGTKIRVHEGVVDIGAKSVLGQECTISAFQHISIGRECIVADRAMLIDFDHGMVETERPIREQGIYKRDVRVGHNAWIGYGACLLRGVNVGDNAVIGTSAVVTADVPENAVVGGVPARLIRMRRKPELLRWE